jgi:hypothetical protein
MSTEKVRVNSQAEVVFTPEKLKRFKEAYQIAADKCVDIFVFDGNEYLTSYAKYLVEYLENKFKEV